jgi:hypothetical protein
MNSQSNKLIHSHATCLRKRRRDLEDLKAVSQNLMHSSPTVTDSIYGILSAEYAGQRIAGIRGGSRYLGTDRRMAGCSHCARDNDQSEGMMRT